jgi:hypothetical protein
MKPMPAKPKIIMAQVAGSETEVMVGHELIFADFICVYKSSSGNRPLSRTARQVP